jgi:TolB protein
MLMTKEPMSAVRHPRIRRWATIVSVALALFVVVDAGVSRPLAAPQAQQPSDIAAVISAGPGSLPKYAVPDFVGATPEAAEIGRTLGQVLWDDLDFEREFYLIPRDTYKTIPVARTPADVPFAAWRELGADGVIFGTVERSGDSLRVDVRLFSVRGQRAVFTQGYDGPASNPRRLAHTISDAIHMQQRNLRGVARTKLAFISDRNRERLIGTVENREVKEVWIADYDGANQRRVTVGRNLNLNPAWSPDARAIAYTVFTPGADIVISRIYEGILQRPTRGQRGNNYLPIYSPDGSRIAFMSTRDGNAEIYVMNVDGSNVRRLTNNPAVDVTPTWSPSGGQIAFTSDRSGRPQIYMMNADGTDVQPITTLVGETEADRPTWSPAPYNEIAYTARTGSWYDIKVYDVATRQTRLLTDGKGSNESPAFSPTGRHLAFTSNRTGANQIYIIGRDGRGLRQITREGNNQTASWSAN